MARPPLPQDMVEMLGRPNPAVMGTVSPRDSAPVTVATWYLWDDGRVLLNLDGRRKRLTHLRTDPRVSLTVLDGDSWYRHVSLHGTVELVPDPDLTDIDRLARHYTGDRYADRDNERVSAWLTVSTYHSWGFDKAPGG